MPYSAGDKLGPYEILAPIGKGGMGEVYRARDSRVGRDVAVKISGERFTERFEREARVIASLNHPNICTLFDVGPNYLVMEFVDGEAPKGPMPVEETLDIMRQVAAALEYAHEKGVVHRDLKPANIRLKSDGGVKVLDFGLAKQTTETPQGADSPTITMEGTEAGVILGTAAYMSPEQARGKIVDKRADIWAFGVVLYELLSGHRLFTGDNVTETLASVVKEQPDLSHVPSSVRRLLDRCLEKDPRKRLRDIGDAIPLIGVAETQTEPPRSRINWAAVLAGVLAIACAGLGYIAYRHSTEEPPKVYRMSAQTPEKWAPIPGVGLAVSPDGKRIAFAGAVDGKTQIWIRDLDSLAARPLPGTEGAINGVFWSPDSRFLGFFDGLKLKKIDIAGGPPLGICDVPNSYAASWGKDYIVITSNSGFLRVPAAGGTPSPLAVVESLSEGFPSSPWFLPDGRHYLFTVIAPALRQSILYSGDVESKDPLKDRRRILVTTGFNTFYSEGYLLSVRDRTLMAQAFDAKNLETRADPVPVAEQVDTFSGVFGLFGVSQNGVLVYTSGATGNLQATWFDRAGKPGGRVGTPVFGMSAAISPDESMIAFDRFDSQSSDVWLADRARGAESRFTFGSTFTAFPIWSPDGSSLAFYSIRDGGGNIYQKPVRTGGEERVLHKEPGFRFPFDWSRDGRYIVEGTTDQKNANDIWVLPLFGDRKPFVYLNSEFNEDQAKVSPNGNWLAYVSDESHRPEVYLQTFPTPGGKIQVSTNGGSYPLWSRNGKELYYVAADQKLMAVETNITGNTLQLGVAKVLFPVRFGGLVPGTAYAYDVTKDGRFLIPTPVENTASVPFSVVINWTAALKK